MEIIEPYLEALQEQAPEHYRYLRTTGSLNAHLRAKAREANQLFDRLTAHLEKAPSGIVLNPQERLAAERAVIEQLTEFPETLPR